MTVTVPSGRRSRTKLIWLVPAVGFMIVLAPVVLLAGAGNPPCTLDRAVADRVSGRVGRVDRDRVRAAVGRDERRPASPPPA